MKKMRGIIAVVATLALATSTVAQSARTSPQIEALFQQATTAIDETRYLQATQYLTRLIELPEHVYSERAQELLGNVREANGQYAHAVAEYEIYLEKYPDGLGASRVQSRLSAILDGATPEPRQPEIASTAAPREMPLPQRPRFGRGTVFADRGIGTSDDPDAVTFTTHGSASLTYRYNEGAIEITEIDPDPLIPNVTDTERDVFDNSVTGTLRFTRVHENAIRTLTFGFSGSLNMSLDGEGTDHRVQEIYAAHTHKESGRVLTFGRHRLKPSGVTYRLDGVSGSMPLENGVTVSAFAGMGVGSTREDLFGSDAIIYGVAAQLPQGMVGPGEMGFYLADEREDGFVLRRALGVEYDLDLNRTNVFANAEVDLNFGKLNRALLTTSTTLEGNTRLTGRLAHYRTPALSLSNALIGQSAGSLSALQGLGLTDDEIEDLALDRSAEVTTLGFTYYRPLDETWNLSAYGSVYHTSGTPDSAAVGGADAVAGVAAEGVRTYFGARMNGQKVFRDRDDLSFGLRYAGSDDNDLYIADAGLRIRMSDELTLRPRVQFGYRDFDDGATETFTVPSVLASYRMDRQTYFNFEVGGRWSTDDSATTVTKQEQFYFSAGVSRSF